MENLNFKHFLESAEKEFKDDIKQTLNKIPASHKKLVHDYKFKSEGGNTLKGDQKHVGEIDEKKKHIKVAAPYNYSRETTILHEIAHAVWKFVLTPDLKKQWSHLLKKTKDEHKDKTNKAAKDSLDQNDEEIFCMSYANAYTKHKNATYNHDAWDNFIKALPK